MVKLGFFQLLLVQFLSSVISEDEVAMCSFFHSTTPLVSKGTGDGGSQGIGFIYWGDGEVKFKDDKLILSLTGNELNVRIGTPIDYRKAEFEFKHNPNLEFTLENKFVADKAVLGFTSSKNGLTAYAYNVPGRLNSTGSFNDNVYLKKHDVKGSIEKSPGSFSLTLPHAALKDDKLPEFDQYSFLSLKIKKVEGGSSDADDNVLKFKSLKFTCEDIKKYKSKDQGKISNGTPTIKVTSLSYVFALLYLATMMTMYWL